MRIYGLDFTSAPSRKKPITCAVCDLQGGVLYVADVERLTDFSMFEAFLARRGPWIAGLDFPFGQPHKLIDGLGWPRSWAAYVGKLSSLEMKDFDAMLKTYRDARPVGDKQHLRPADVAAGAQSPMMMYGVPVGKMFFKGAPRLLESGVSVIPCRPTDSESVVIEAYPRLAVSLLSGGRSYKNDTRSKQTDFQREVRRTLAAALRSDVVRARYGVTIRLVDRLAAELVNDPSGDVLDAVLCALPAAWAYGRRESGYGVPEACNPDEGWIVDPLLAEWPRMAGQ